MQPFFLQEDCTQNPKEKAIEMKQRNGDFIANLSIMRDKMVITIPMCLHDRFHTAILYVQTQRLEANQHKIVPLPLSPITKSVQEDSMINGVKNCRKVLLLTKIRNDDK